MFAAKGLIGYFNLADWWNDALTKDERDCIVKKYGNDLIHGDRTLKHSSACLFLAHLTMWINTKAEYPIAIKLVKKAEREYTNSIDIIDMHFYFAHLIKFYYKNRDINDNFEKAIEYCNKQISISKETSKRLNDYDCLPSHIGFEQLAIIEEKRENYAEAIAVSSRAKKEGWSGDWDKRIKRCAEKLQKIN